MGTRTWATFAGPLLLLLLLSLLLLTDSTTAMPLDQAATNKTKRANENNGNGSGPGDRSPGGEPPSSPKSHDPPFLLPVVVSALIVVLVVVLWGSWRWYERRSQSQGQGEAGEMVWAEIWRAGLTVGIGLQEADMGANRRSMRMSGAWEPTGRDRDRDRDWDRDRGGPGRGEGQEVVWEEEDERPSTSTSASSRLRTPTFWEVDIGRLPSLPLMDELGNGKVRLLVSARQATD